MVQTVPCRIQEVRRDPMNRYHSQRGAIPRWLGLAAGLLALTGCATNPYTERSQLLLVPESEEMQLGAQAYEQVLHNPKVKISRDPREVEPVTRVAARIIEAAKSSKYAERARQFDWEVTVIKDDKTMNAFALPGGKIAVYTGIFPVAKNEAGLAAILGHEVTHALARHGAERMRQGLLAQIGLEAASIALGSGRSEEHTSELQSRLHLVCRLLLEKKKKKQTQRPQSSTRKTDTHTTRTRSLAA